MTIMQKYYNQYKEHTLKEFWDWWSDKNSATVMVMEIRLLVGVKKVDYSWLKNYAYANKLIFSGSSFFVSSYEQLLTIMKNATIRNNYNIYYGLNPRKKCFKIYEGKTYSAYGGKLVNVESIKFVGFDIESALRKDVATPDELLNAEKLVDYMIASLEKKFGWRDYVKICSANGFHLIYKLDMGGIELPDLEYNTVQRKRKKKVDGKDKLIDVEEIAYKETKEFITLKKVVNNLIEDVKSKLDGKWDTKMDKTGDLSRVMRLPMSKNCKKAYSEHRWSGIISFGSDDIGKSINIGMSKSLKSRASRIFDTVTINKDLKKFPIPPSHTYNVNTIESSEIVQLLLSKMLDVGERNHYLEFQFALLLRDNDIHPDQIQELLSRINAVQDKIVQVDPKYLPDDGNFNPDIVNQFCYINFIPPVYPVFKDRPENLHMKTIEWVDGKIDIKDYPTTNIMKAIRLLSQELKNFSDYNIKIRKIQSFIRFMNKHYGERTSKYYCNLYNHGEYQLLTRLINVL